MYQWLADSDTGTLVIRGQPVTIDYLQGGPKGQGRIKIEAREVERLKELMRVRPRPPWQRRPPTKLHHYPRLPVDQSICPEKGQPSRYFDPAENTHRKPTTKATPRK